MQMQYRFAVNFGTLSIYRKYLLLFLLFSQVKRGWIVSTPPLITTKVKVLSVPKFTANLYCICLSKPQIYTKAEAVQICGRFWDTQYIALGGNKQLKRPNFTIRIFH